MSSQLVWLITGTSSGIGRDLAISALERGDLVIATGRARSIEKLDDLKALGASTIELDVTDKLENLHEVAKRAVAVYGRIDVLVNNAGYILVGTIEESTPEETLEQFNTNVFGALNVTRAFLPYMRERRTGTVVFIGSVGGWQSSPYAGLYVTSKWTLRGISQSLHDEISPLGLRSTCIDFGFFRTPFLSSTQRAPPVSRISDYQPLCERVEAVLNACDRKQPGDPKKGVEVIIDVVRGEGVAKDKPFPKGVALGTDCYKLMKSHCEEGLARAEEWKEISCSTDFPPDA
ncbi:short chain dehydrogenase [Cyathus striatus]|nr:short chain dehydrogenase [Cyathus striatus]